MLWSGRLLSTDAWWLWIFERVWNREVRERFESAPDFIGNQRDNEIDHFSFLAEVVICLSFICKLFLLYTFGYLVMIILIVKQKKFMFENNYFYYWVSSDL